MPTMKTTVRASELSTLLDRAPTSVRILSLDCFDTLLWRDVNAPNDVFADLEVAGGGLEPRRRPGLAGPIPLIPALGWASAKRK